MANQDQLAYWNEVAGPKWVALGDEIEARLDAINQLLLRHCAARPGEAVLEIGAGTGITTVKLARAVAPGGHVTGVDISATMLTAARRRCAGLANVSFMEADAQTDDFGRQKYDLLASRFGVMFFVDPRAAFSNLRRVLAPGGRLCFVCWASLAQNPHWQIPLDIVAAALGPPAPKPPRSPGPMAFSEVDYVQSILRDAGFTGITVTPVEVPIIGKTLAGETRAASLIGPAGGLLDEKQADAAARARLSGLIETAISGFDTPHGPRLPATVFVVKGS